jgi:hypothetical protein
MAPASPITEYKLALIRDWTEPAASRADVRASSIVALSAVALLRKPITVAVMARLATTKAVAAAHILVLREKL